ERRQALVEQIGSGIILIMGNRYSPMNYRDNTYHFRQDSNFLYYFGLDLAGLNGYIDLDKNEACIVGAEVTIDDVIWSGPQPTLSELAAQVGINKILPVEKMVDQLKAARNAATPVHFLPPYRHDNMMDLHNWLGIPLGEMKQQASTALIKAVVQQRAYKTPEEIVEMEKAVNTTREMHVTAMRLAKAGMTEAQLAGMVQAVAVGGGGNLAYPVILTVNGHVLHNHYHGNVLRSGQMILGDFGAENAMRYAGDITRTFPVDAQFTTRQREIYELVLRAEEQSIAALRPGITYQEIHLDAARLMANGLKELGIMKGDIEEAISVGAHALFFPHGLGHMIGLDVHDMEDLGEDLVGYDEQTTRSDQFGLRALRLGRKLEPGFVLTVEPGLYFIPELIDVWQKEGKHTDFIDYQALQAYRVGHWLWKQGRADMAYFFQMRVSEVFGVDVHP
ncbi:MAG: aminopeptidase P N-terminal domain-containing protein, partial [Bacteroidota bacterium]